MAHYHFPSPQPKTPENSIEQRDISELARLTETPGFIPSTAVFDSLRLTTGQLATNFDEGGSRGKGAFLDDKDKSVPDKDAETIFTASQYRTWELDDDTRIKYREALDSVREPGDVATQPKAVKDLYARIVVGNVALGNISEIIQSFRSALVKSLVLHEHIQEQKQNDRVVRVWERKGANIAHNHLIMEAPELFDRVDEDGSGNYVCYQTVTRPDGSLGEKRLSQVEAEYLVKYRRELLELRRMDELDRRAEKIKRNYENHVLHMQNYRMWVTGGHDPDARTWASLPKELRKGDWRGSDFDKPFTYTDSSGQTLTTTLRQASRPWNSDAFEAGDAVKIATNLTEWSAIPSIFRGLSTILRIPKTAVQNAEKQTAFIEATDKKRSIEQQLKEIRKIYEISGTKSKPLGSYNFDELEQSFEALRTIDIDAWFAEKKRWFLRYAPQEKTAQQERERARQVIQAQISGQNPFAGYIGGALSPYVSAASIIQKDIAALSDPYQKYLRSQYYMDADDDPKLLGKPKTVNKLKGALSNAGN